jgi:tetratricopeptide (TPR) repeat protein
VGIHPSVAPRHGDTFFSFSDVAVVRQADEALGNGARFRAVLRNLVASRNGQLTLDFRIEAQHAKVLQLKRREPPPMAALMDSPPIADDSTADQYFAAASILDDGNPENFEEASHAYRRALEIDPYLVPALINLANIHYSRDEIAEAQALYERAVALDPEVFEAHFNLGNILHDLARYREAQACYREALKLNPTYADAHFYLAVTDGEERAVTRRAGALEGVPATGTARRMGGAGAGILGLTNFNSSIRPFLPAYQSQ